MTPTHEFLKMLIDQNRLTSSYYFQRIDESNLEWRLTPRSASVGFIYRHIGEIMNLLGTVLGCPAEVTNTTMGFQDTGQGKNLEESIELIERGYTTLYEMALKHKSDWWAEKVKAPIFGTVERLKIFGHILNHTAQHAGQISLILTRMPESNRD